MQLTSAQFILIEPSEKKSYLERWKRSSWTPILLTLALSIFVTFSIYAVFIAFIWRGDTGSFLDTVANLHFPNVTPGGEGSIYQHPRPVELMRTRRSTENDILTLRRSPCCLLNSERLAKVNSVAEAVELTRNNEYISDLRTFSKDLIVLKRLMSQLTEECRSDPWTTLLGSQYRRFRRNIRPPWMDTAQTSPGEGIRTYQQTNIHTPPVFKPLCYAVASNSGGINKVCTSFNVPHNTPYSQVGSPWREPHRQDQMHVPTAVAAPNPYNDIIVKQGDNSQSDGDQFQTGYPAFHPQTGFISFDHPQLQVGPMSANNQPWESQFGYLVQPPRPPPVSYPQPMLPLYPRIQPQSVQNPMFLPPQQQICTYVPVPGSIYRFPPVPGVTTSSYPTPVANSRAAVNETSSSKSSGACPPQEIACGTGECIGNTNWCDGISHCLDNSDENRCSCRSKMPPLKICDGYNDCPEAEDELGCHTCSESMFDCEDWSSNNYRSTCIMKNKRCDEIVDCPNKRDELDCTLLTDRIGPKEILVSYGKGYLHRNYKGIWYPVCGENEVAYSAKTACTSEFGHQRMLASITRLSLMTHYGGMYIKSNPLSLVHSCEDAKIVWVECPPLDCGMKSPQAMEREVLMTRFKRYLQEKGFYEEGTQNRTHLKICRAAPESRTVSDLLDGYFPRFNPQIENEDLYNRIWGNLNLPYLGYAMPPRLANPEQTRRDDQFHRRQRFRRDGRVVGGTVSNPGDWPWLVMMHKDGVFHCGGVILNENLILTAAHCVDGYEGSFFEIKAGIQRRLSYSPQDQLRKISSVILHENYERSDYSNDLAVVELNKPLLYNRWVLPICLPPVELPSLPAPNTMCIVVGWGAVQEHGMNPDDMHEVEVPILSYCKHKTDQVANDICAGYWAGGKDSCQGDSGGPLLCKLKHLDKWYVAGIVSHGDGCARFDEPGVYTRVSSYIPWIASVSVKKRNMLTKPLQSCPGHQCLFSQCLPKGLECNGIIDCLYSDDELHCDNPFMDSLFKSAITSGKEANVNVSIVTNNVTNAEKGNSEFNSSTLKGASTLISSVELTHQQSFNVSNSNIFMDNSSSKEGHTMISTKHSIFNADKHKSNENFLVETTTTTPVVTTVQQFSAPQERLETVSSNPTPDITCICKMKVSTETASTHQTSKNNSVLRVESATSQLDQETKTLESNGTILSLPTSPPKSFEQEEFGIENHSIPKKLCQVLCTEAVDVASPLSQTDNTTNSTNEQISTSSISTKSLYEVVTEQKQSGEGCPESGKITNNITNAPANAIPCDFNKTTDVCKLLPFSTKNQSTVKDNIASTPDNVTPTGDTTTSLDDTTDPTQDTTVVTQMPNESNFMNNYVDETNQSHSGVTIESNVTEQSSEAWASGSLMVNSSEVMSNVSPYTEKTEYAIRKLSSHLPTTEVTVTDVVEQSSKTKGWTTTEKQIITSQASVDNFNYKSSNHSHHDKNNTFAQTNLTSLITSSITVSEPTVPNSSRFQTTYETTSQPTEPFTLSTTTFKPQGALPIDSFSQKRPPEEDSLTPVRLSTVESSTVESSTFEPSIAETSSPGSLFMGQHFIPKEDVFQCKRFKQQILIHRVCDGIVDCMDKSDEKNCSCLQKLTVEAPELICDHFWNCPEGVDEVNCSSACGVDEFYCFKDEKCIPLEKQCNGKSDCVGGEDEIDCYALVDPRSRKVKRDVSGRPALISEGVIVRWDSVNSHWMSECANKSNLFNLAADVCISLGFGEYSDKTQILQEKAFTYDEKRDKLEHDSRSCLLIHVECFAPMASHRPWQVLINIDGSLSAMGVLISSRHVVAALPSSISRQKRYLSASLGQSASSLKMVRPIYEQNVRVARMAPIKGTELAVLFLANDTELSHGVVPMTSFVPLSDDLFDIRCQMVTVDRNGKEVATNVESVQCNDPERLCFKALNSSSACQKPLMPISGYIACYDYGKGDGSFLVSVFQAMNGLCKPECFINLITHNDFINDLLEVENSGSIVMQPECSSHRCPHGQCLPWDKIDDGVLDCTDGSDESEQMANHKKMHCSRSKTCGCPSGNFQCHSGECIPLNKFCDSTKDCSDNSDETHDCHLCYHLINITSPKSLCNGRPNCLDKSDESLKLCAGKSDCSSPEFFNCSKDMTCIPKDFVCDGINDCSYGEDEANCRALQYKIINKKEGMLMEKRNGHWLPYCVERQLPPAFLENLCELIGNWKYDSHRLETVEKKIVVVDSYTEIALNSQVKMAIRPNRQYSSVIGNGTCEALYIICK